MSNAKKILYLARELVFPRRCPVCDKPVLPQGGLICDACRNAFTPFSMQTPTCLKCGKPLRREELEYCYDCRRHPHVFTQGCAVYRYREVSGAIYQFKFNDREEYADFFGMMMARRICDVFFWRLDENVSGQARKPQMVPGRGIDMLLPVPASRQRTAQRGYNQAQLLADVISKITGIPVYHDVLRRQVNTPYLKGMDRNARQMQLKKAFLVYGNVVESKCVMLIDDIYTTGSTIDACALALRQAGAKEVLFCTLAIGEGKE